MVTVRNPTPKLPDSVYAAMSDVLAAIFAHADLAAPFADLLPRRAFADYYKLIKAPSALNPVAANVRRRTYTAAADFVRDVQQIWYNAKLYNQEGSEIYEAAETLEGVFKEALGKGELRGESVPDLGPLPGDGESEGEGEEEGGDGSEASEEEEEEESEGEDEEEEEEEEEEEDAKRKRTSRGRGRPSLASRRTSARKSEIKAEVEEAEEEGGRKVRDDPRRKRGRPPRVETPMEIRIKHIFKALRNLRDDDTGVQRLAPFEKLPEKKEFPEYYQEIKNPMALDIVRRNVKRRVYKTLDMFLHDMELMFENAKAFNEDDSAVHLAAVALQDELRAVAAVESAKTDAELAGGGDEGASKNQRIPLAYIEHKGEQYRVGDWIHILNPNDPNKPTVAQLFRTWKDAKDPSGTPWINACWYYRPEQTVHWIEKKFYPDEVVKTGQYRDHQAHEIVGKCHVMFFTKYSRGRPVGIDERRTPVYVCESRYNEVEKHFNKIKTWKSCIPDEVRGHDDELTLFAKQRPLRKVPSPIAHLLPANAREDDPMPDAKLGANPNAPPVIGAVFKRARRDTDSPPPEPTPPPPPPPPVVAPTPAPPPVRVNPDYHETMSMTQMYKQAHQAASLSTPTPAPAPPRAPPTPNAVALQVQAQMQQRAAHVAAPMLHHPPPQLALPHQQLPPTTFTLPDSVTHALPAEVAERFLRDREGRMLWFSVPPLAAPEGGVGVGHSVQYLARRRELEERRRRRRERMREEEKTRARFAAQRVQVEREQAEEVLGRALGVVAEGIRDGWKALGAKGAKEGAKEAMEVEM
ncbi:putative RSC complex subunit [Geopyxis carbonaria]|nr:putative RSC complex subunit [Geopyxis carbonaria]